MYFSKSELFEVIQLARPLLILLVCLAHVPAIQGYPSDFDRYDQLGTLFAIYLKDFLARGAVPILTVISGYLAVSTFRKKHYAAYIGVKCQRLVLPFLVWNILPLIFFFSLYQELGLNFLSSAKIDDWSDAIAAVLGLHRLPFNPPTYFLRDLFLLMMLVPVIDWFMMSKLRLVTLALGYGLAMLFSPGLGIPVLGEHVYLFYRSDMPLFFVFGYFLACYTIKIPKISVYSAFMLAIMMAMLGVLISMALSAFDPSLITYLLIKMFFSVLFVLLAPALFVGLLALRDTSVGCVLNFLAPYSFTLFLSHLVSSTIFITFARSKFRWLVSERSPVWEQSAYIFCYLLLVVVLAIAIRIGWLFMLRRCLPSRLANQVA